MPLGINGKAEAFRVEAASKTPCGRAPGYRSNGNAGTLGGVGNYGYNWTSMVNGTNGMNLSFHVTWLNPGGAYYRSYGYLLRCLSE